VRKQPQVQLALDLLRKGRPIAADDFHADELHGVSTVGESRIALAGAARAVPCLGEKQLRVELLELELELTRHSPACFDVLRELAIQLRRELASACKRRFRILDARLHEQAVRIAVENPKARVFEPLLRPEQQLTPRARDRICEGGIVETA